MRTPRRQPGMRTPTSCVFLCTTLAPEHPVTSQTTIITWPLKEKHQISIKSKVDFCSNCCQVYESKLDSISHYFSHILLYEDKNLKVSIKYNGPIKAPIKKGDKIAQLVIRSQDLPETTHDLLAGDDVSIGGFLVRIRTAGHYLFNMLYTNSEESL